MYVADRVANRIQKFQADGTFVWARNGTTGAGQFDQPSGVATDSAGNVYVTDRVANRVQKFNSSGDFVAAFGAGQMSLPTGIDVSAGGTVYVTNEGTNVVQRWDTSGVLIGSFDGSGVANGGNPAFGNPLDVSVSSETGKVFVVDDAGNSVEQFSSTGTYEFKWDAAGSAGGQFASPAGCGHRHARPVLRDGRRATAGSSASTGRSTAPSSARAARGSCSRPTPAPRTWS